MADIIVRIPERQIPHFIEDKMTSDVAFWRFSRKPRNLNIGDYIFFSRPEGVTFAAPVHKFVEGDDMLEELGFGIVGTIGNHNALWKGATETKRLDPPVTGINYSQQGYRYLTKDEQRKLRKRLSVARRKPK